MLLDKIKSEIDTHNVISFDIFDTLLMRPYIKPTDVFRHMEKTYNRLGFATTRINAEASARKKHPQYEDITLDEIYDEIDPIYLDLKEKEIQWEEKILQPNPQIQKIFEYTKKQGKKIIIVSDMYLTEQELIPILKEKGYDGFFKLYVSSRYRKTKHSGRLFQEVIQDLKIHPSEILHLGDNSISDYEQPCNEGMDALLTKKPLDILIKKDIRIQSFLDEHSDNLNISILLGLISFIYASEEQNYWKILGFKYGGPAIFAYTSWIKKQLEKTDYTDVWFIARDGYTLQKVFDLLNKKKKFSSNYIYAPRVLNNLICLPYSDIHKVNKLQGLSTVKQIINYYKNMHPVLKNETPITIQNYEEGSKFIEKHFDIYKKLAQKSKEDYLKYLLPNITSKKIAIVDTISVALSSQRFLSKILDTSNVSLQGYYWGLPKSSLDNSKFETFSFQKENKWIFDDWDIMEFLITAPEPPIYGLKNGIPEHKELSHEEKIRMKLYPFVHEGSIEFAQLALKCFDEILLDFSAEEIATWINNFTSIPSKWEQNYIRRIKHAYDSANECYVPICKSWWSFQANLRIRNWKKSTHHYTLYILKNIPLLRVKNNAQSIHILNMPFFSIERKTKKIIYRLFNLPIFSIKESQKNV